MRHRRSNYPQQQPKVIAIAATQQAGHSPYLIGAALSLLLMSLMLFS